MQITLVPLSVAVMQALLDDDLEAASAGAGVQLTPYLLEHGWLWRYRVDQVAGDPDALPWLVHAVVDVASGAVVGHAGFHGPPDERGMVEVGYSVDPAFRRRGFATEIVRTMLAWAASEPRVRVVRASISPDNVASLGTIRPFGFEAVGEQWDEEDGRELLFETDPRRATDQG